MRWTLNNGVHSRTVMMMWHYAWWCDTLYDDVTLCMMMWDYAWWCDTLYDDVTLWHCVWWCDTMYDDVILCMVMRRWARPRNRETQYKVSTRSVQGQYNSLSLSLSIYYKVSTRSVQGSGSTHLKILS
jgi:hypothetical protein